MLHLKGTNSEGNYKETQFICVWDSKKIAMITDMGVIPSIGETLILEGIPYKVTDLVYEPEENHLFIYLELLIKEAE